MVVFHSFADLCDGALGGAAYLFNLVLPGNAL
jgi:hypothetical protein